MQSGNQTVRQRKQKDGDESDSPTSDVAHQTIQSQENLDKKNIPRLTLLEEVFLLGLKDSQVIQITHSTFDHHL